MEKKELQIQAIPTLTQCKGIQIDMSINRPDKNIVDIKNVLLFKILSKKIVVIVPGNNKAPDMATFKCISPLIFPINCETP